MATDERLVLQRSRLSSGRVNIVAAATTTALFTCVANRRYIIRKVIVHNNQGAPVDVSLGYTNLAAAWVPVMPDLTAINALDNTWIEDELPICGNTPQGFMIDTTLLTGWAGVIAARSSAAAAVPNEVQIEIEVEEIM